MACNHNWRTTARTKHGNRVLVQEVCYACGATREYWEEA